MCSLSDVVTKPWHGHHNVPLRIKSVIDTSAESLGLTNKILNLRPCDHMVVAYSECGGERMPSRPWFGNWNLHPIFQQINPPRRGDQFWNSLHFGNIVLFVFCSCFSLQILSTPLILIQAPLQEAQEKALQAALHVFNTEAVGGGTARKKYERQLHITAKNQFDVMLRFLSVIFILVTFNRLCVVYVLTLILSRK